jgi:hypothetical protein
MDELELWLFRDAINSGREQMQEASRRYSSLSNFERGSVPGPVSRCHSSDSLRSPNMDRQKLLQPSNLSWLTARHMELYLIL